MQKKKTGLRCSRSSTHLHVVHLVLAYDFDGDLAVLALQVAGSVDVAEGAIAHLLNELPSLEAWVVGELGLAGVLLGDELGEAGLVYLAALSVSGRLLFEVVGAGEARVGIRRNLFVSESFGLASVFFRVGAGLFACGRGC